MKLQIVFGDLSHDTIGLATEVFPLNVGYVAAYCQMMFGDDVEIQIVKYISELENIIEKSPPDILALSNYPWCHNISMAMFKSLRERRSESLCIMGGSNFPHSPKLQQDFLSARPLIDAYVFLDGEVGFSNLIQLIRDIGDLQEARSVFRSKPVEGCVQLDTAGRLLAASQPIRIKNLDEIPSPYLTGLMDKFFDGRLSPLIQTNRGCPFKCTFCHDGSSLVNKVNKFSLERVTSEIRYIAERVPKNINSLFISDLNFGMYKRDLEICEELRSTRKEYDYPHYIDSTTGKNSQERIINAIDKLDGALAIGLSMQSLTPSVLTNIKRDNIKLSDYMNLMPAIRNSNLRTKTEIICPLPGETKESHIDNFAELLNKGMDFICIWTTMLVNGSEMSTPEEREKWGLETKFRVIPRDFTQLRNGTNVIEVEEVAIATNTLPFEDYVFCRKLSFLVTITSNPGIRSLYYFLSEAGIPAITVILNTLEDIGGSGDVGDLKKISTLFHDFETETRGELWDSEEELIEFFQDSSNFQGLIDGKYGANLMQTYSARAYASCMEELIISLFRQTRKLIDSLNIDDRYVRILDDVEKYCRGCTFNLLGEDRMETIPEERISYDFKNWLMSPDKQELSHFKWPYPRTNRFIITQNQWKLIEDGLDQFGHNDLGRGKILTRINTDTLWRQAEYD